MKSKLKTKSVINESGTTMTLIENQRVRSGMNYSGGVSDGTEFKNYIFKNCDIAPGQLWHLEKVENIEFHDCKISICHIISEWENSKRPLFKNIKIKNCIINGKSIIDNCILENVFIENLKIAGYLRIAGSVFKHVTFKKHIGTIAILNDPVLYLVDTKYQNLNEQIVRNNAEFYKKVDWAIDISTLEAVEFEIIDIPSQLLRLDPDSQIVISYENIRNIEWEKLPFKAKMFIDISLYDLIDLKKEEVILIAPRKDKEFENIIHDIRLLKSEGIAK